MKARIPPTRQEKRNLEIAARILCKQELDIQRDTLMRKFEKLMCYCLNNKFGFGKKRLNELIFAMKETDDQYDNDPIFWEHIDRIVIDTLGMDFERDYTDEMSK